MITMSHHSHLDEWKPTSIGPRTSGVEMVMGEAMEL